MIVDWISNIAKYTSLLDEQAIDHIKQIEDNKYFVKVKNGISAKKSIVKTVDGNKCIVESHKNHIDIHIPLDCVEIFYYYFADDVIYNDYDWENDVVKYDKINDNKSKILVNPGQFILFDLMEIHSSSVSNTFTESIRKIVIKIESNVDSTHLK